MTERSRRVYGARARIALLVPSPNSVAEIEFWRMAPAGVTVHTSRMPFFGERDERPFEAMEAAVPRVIEEALTAAPDVIAYGCTASSAKPDPEAYERGLARAAGRETVTAAASIVHAVRRFGASRIALITPYPQAINDKERAFFAAQGIEVVIDESVIVDDAQQRLRNMCSVPPERIVERGVALGARADVDMVVLSCTDMATADAVEAIESATAKPATSSNQALLWRALRAAGVADAIPGFGRLLRAA